MITSIDIGIKNFGIFICSENFIPVYMNNLNFEPYSLENIVSILNKIYLEELKLYDFTKDHTILIEQQLFKNAKVFTVYNHIQMYYFLKLKSNVIICNSKNKNIEKTCKYNIRKKLAVEKALNFLNSLEDKKWLKILSSKKKKDDISDAICQFMFYYKLHTIK